MNAIELKHVNNTHAILLKKIKKDGPLIQRRS